MTASHSHQTLTSGRAATSGRRGARTVRRVIAAPRVDWSPSYIAFLVYIFVITTYRFQLGTEAMIAALLFLPLESRPLRFPRPVMWAVAFLLWGYVGWVGSEYRADVWKACTDLAKICAVMLVAVNVLTTRPRLRFFLLAFLGFFAFYPVRGALFSFFIYHGTVEGRAAWNYIYSNPNDLASLCLLPLALSIGMMFTERAGWARYCAMAGVITIPFVILLTQSRGAFIALSIFALVVLKGTEKRRRGKILLLGSVAAVVIALAVPSSTWTRLSTISDVTNAESAAKVQDEGSARQRLELWRVARRIFIEHPIVGVGLGAYQDAHYVYAMRPEFNPIALGHRDAHSTYYRLLAESGLVGFVLFFGMIGVTVYDAERTRRRAVAYPALATQIFYMEVGLVGYFVAGIWGSYSSMVLTYIYIAVLYSATQLLKGDLPLPGQALRARRARLAQAHTLRARPVIS